MVRQRQSILCIVVDTTIEPIIMESGGRTTATMYVARPYCERAKGEKTDGHCTSDNARVGCTILVVFQHEGQSDPPHFWSFRFVDFSE